MSTQGKLLRQALKFNHNEPNYKSIESLYLEALEYQKDVNIAFIYATPGKRAKLLDKIVFFQFLSEKIAKCKIETFEDITNILAADTRAKNIDATGNSKNRYTKVFDKTILFQYEDNLPQLYKTTRIPIVEDKIVVVENAESFLNIYPIMKKYHYKYFVYLGGYGNKITREFLKDKDIVCFLDYDIEAIHIYDSIECRSKKFFKHPNLEFYFEKQKNKSNELYLTQLTRLPKSHAELQWLINLINTYSNVLEQEVIND
ncbi:hypothetical protein CRV00_05620 [Malaciobacter molluscorum]|uniref:hypothetical protein n=1 Tax=Malaciobacter molluscorum TaxID=1032072 RepID=UPI00100AC51C|nr:hypothetical protein [Malaciobacter molluscorum]RXJ94810.1 hypothetical protein CRV00_05620 [Malaciobacter molluscorum]